MPESDTQTADGEGQEADKPPHDPLPLQMNPNIIPKPKEKGSLANGVMRMFNGGHSARNPAAITAAKPSEPPGSKPPHSGKTDKIKSSAQHSKSGATTPSTGLSPSASDSEWGPSPPSTRPPSRAVSVSHGEPAPKDATTDTSSQQTMRPAVPPSAPPSRASSIKSLRSSDGEGKFTLKELLAATPKLGRRSSQRSSGGSSKKSDSDRSDSATSLAKKYGVCERVAIGKGATSVVRLAHKWDRTEEKLYAVKVGCSSFFLARRLTSLTIRNSVRDGKMKQKKSTSRSLQPSFASPPPYIT